MSFFKVVRHPERPYLHIPNAAYRRYLHSQPPTYDINLFLRPDLRYVVGLREINHELFITQGWATIQNHVDIGLKYVLVFRIQDPRNWSVTILGDNCVNIDLRHIAPNYAIPVHWSDEDDDVDDVVAPPPAPAEAGQPIFPAEVAHPDPPAEAAHPQPLAGAAQPDQPNLDDQPNDVHIASVATFSQIVRINKSIAYVPPKLAALADLEYTMLLTIKVEDQEVYVAQVRKEDKDRKPRYIVRRWANIVNIHGLRQGDRCLFEYNVDDDYLMITKGNRAQGILLASFFYKFQRFLVEQNVLIIKKPMLGSNGGSWHVIDSPYKICFNRETIVATSPDWNGTNHAFNFTDFSTIIDYIIGVVIECSPMKYKKKPDGKESKWVVVKLQDLSGLIIWMTLFEDYAVKITEYVLSNPGVPHYGVIIQFAMFKVFNDRHSLSNSFNISNLFINDPDIQEITTFIERFNLTEAGQSSSYRSGSNSGLMSKEHDFLTVTEFKYSAEVGQMSQAKHVVVLGTIKFIENQWFYMACNHCRKIVTSSLEPLEKKEEEPGSPREVLIYHCNTYDCLKNKLIIQGYPRYKVLLKVQDSTGNVDLTLFDTEAKKITNKTALEVFEAYTPKEPENKPDYDDVPAMNIPDEIAAFINKKYAFKIEVTNDHISKKYKYYTINSLTDDEKIIGALEEKHFKHEVATDDSGIKSSDNVSGKEVISICDDNVTPSSVDSSAKIIDPDKALNQLKRNLHESYENDVVPTMCSAKKQLPSIKSDSNSNDSADPVMPGKLLIPKKEK
ncbi:hypothetical protein SSX86_014720 [Deinandra increscens subsp. villosa]|uniref:Replication factor A C-terminal domain-containing protein n=1 Tax=Deinandra increscens subsp. villosa TaxID=3103831 RepID=A0AAP0H0L2_9ASTR